MATVFTHAALPLIGARALKLEPREARRLAVTGAIVACLPELDLLGALFEIHPRDAWGHRGLTHSLLFAAAVTVAVMLVAPPLPRGRKLGWLWVFGCAASHGLLDALSHGELGVALFAPLSGVRVLAPFAPLAVSPLGVDEAFGRMGALVMLNEVLVVWVPAWLFVSAVRSAEAHAKLAVASVAWLAVCVALGLGLPGFFAPLPRVLESPRAPLDWLPQPVETRWSVLSALLDQELKPERPLWSSTFFPWWYGGEAGRWQDGRLTLVRRTLLGFDPEDVVGLRGDAAAVARFSPTEKYDLAVGDLSLSATRQALQATHNGHPRYWFGLCNGVAAAAMHEAEPFRAVDVISPAGDRVRFLPQDVKALLAASYFWMESVSGPRNSCRYVGLDSGKVCSMNPAVAVLATLNRLGLARQTFVIDVVPALQSQFYAVASARVALRRGPYPYDGTPAAAGVQVAQLVDLELAMTMSSTTLGYEIANRRVDDTHYQKVGLQPVQFSWPLTLGLSDAGEVIAGRWTGTPADGPDTLFVVAGSPLLADADAGTLEFNPHLRWPLIRELAHASVQEGPDVPLLDLRADETRRLVALPAAPAP